MRLFQSVISRTNYYRRIIRSYMFCFRYLPFEQAKRMPFFLDEPIEVLELNKGDIILHGEIRPKMIWIGGGEGFYRKRGLTMMINKGGKLIFDGSAFFANGGYIRVHENATLTVGHKFGMNVNCILRAVTNVTFGKQVMIGWDNEIIDSDGHDVWVDGNHVEKAQPIYIGNHVWITSHVRISKGVTIADECIVAKGAVVTKKHEVPHTLIGGVPAKDIKYGVEWKK